MLDHSRHLKVLKSGRVLLHLTATGCHLPYGITQCYLPLDTSEHIPVTPAAKQACTRTGLSGSKNACSDSVGKLL